MELKTMYPPHKDSPSTFLVGGITASDTTLNVGSAAILPQTFPYPLTIGIDKSSTETVMVTAADIHQNRLTVTRGEGSKTWDAGTKVARVFNAADLEAVQSNITKISTATDTTTAGIADAKQDIAELKTIVGGSNSGLVKMIADETKRAKAAEQAEKTRAERIEAQLFSEKADKKHLTQVVTDWAYSADGTKLEVTISRFNSSNNATTTAKKTIPVATQTAAGIITPATVKEIVDLRTDIRALQDAGGKFIGQSFPTRAALTSYSVPATVKRGDFTYVIDDETRQGATTRYVYSGTAFDFAFVVNYDPVGLATAQQAGLIRLGDAPGRTTADSEGIGYTKDGAIILSETLTINPNNWVSNNYTTDPTIVIPEGAVGGTLYFGLYADENGVDPSMEKLIRRAKITCDFDGSQYMINCHGLTPNDVIKIQVTFTYKL